MPPISKNRVRLFRLMAVVLALGTFCLLEGLLWVFDLGSSPANDPTSGFNASIPLFALGDDEQDYVTSPARLEFFAEQRFSAKKADEAFRTFFLGGSTVLGHPYQPDTGFSTWFQLELEARTDKLVEAVNCGGISYATHRLLPVLIEVLGYEPDLIVIASGHNEFLEDRTYKATKYRLPVFGAVQDRVLSLRSVSLARELFDNLNGAETEREPPGDVDARLDHASGYASYHFDPEWKQSIIAEYQANLELMAGKCQERGVPLVFVNLGCNLRDCPPFKSEHSRELSPQQTKQWDTLVNRAFELQETDADAALELYRQAEAVDHQFAHLSYRKAQCLDRLGRFEEAYQLYVEAKDLDICPLRMVESMHTVLRQVARSNQIPLLDARSLLEESSPYRLAGANLYLDHVHPSIAGHQMIARQLVETVDRKGLINLDAALSDQQRTAIYSEQLDRLGDLYLAQGRLRLEWLEDWARRDRLTRLQVARDLRTKLEVAFMHEDFGQPASALEQYHRLADEYSEGLLPPLLERCRHLRAQGRTEAAMRIERFLDSSPPGARPSREQRTRSSDGKRREDAIGRRGKGRRKRSDRR